MIELVCLAILAKRRVGVQSIPSIAYTQVGNLGEFGGQVFSKYFLRCQDILEECYSWLIPCFLKQVQFTTKINQVLIVPVLSGVYVLSHMYFIK